MDEMKWYWGVLLSFLSAALLLFSFPPFDLNFLAFFALVPVVFLAYRSSLKRTIGYSILFAFSFYCLLLFWMNAYMAVVGVAFVTVVYGSYFVIALVIINVTARAFPIYRVILTPFIWIAIDYIRSFGFLGLTFGSIGYTQHNFTRFIQIADIGGEQLVAFILILLNAGLAELLPYLAGRATAVRMRSSRLNQILQASERLKPHYSVPLFLAVMFIVLSLFYGTVML